ncbi:MAG TPA: hypothetical protein VFG74_09005 [Miltoncostaeaceae bacterium]|jgi:hypothetical protein|nr:hypothetical protein [Miltoncostaeaceae bacterium]
MRGTGDDRDHRRDDGTLRETSFSAYCSARDRFFATLRADHETRRLEAAWTLPARAPATQGPSA